MIPAATAWLHMQDGFTFQVLRSKAYDRMTTEIHARRIPVPWDLSLTIRFLSFTVTDWPTKLFTNTNNSWCRISHDRRIISSNQSPVLYHSAYLKRILSNPTCARNRNRWIHTRGIKSNRPRSSSTHWSWYRLVSKQPWYDWTLSS